jgi:hypothetical protein
MSRLAVVGDRQRWPRSGSQCDEQGQILVLVLAMLILLGILVGALAGLAAPSFTHANVVRNLGDTVADNNSGIEYGIQALNDNPKPCLVAPPQPVPIPAPPATMPPFNGHRVTLTCQQVGPPPGTQPQTGISYILLQSTAQAASGQTNPLVASAVVEMNNLTGSTTIVSWRTCRDPGC